MGTNRFSEAAKTAANLTNKQLSTQISSLALISQDKLNELLPLKKDKQAFVQLMNEVEADTTTDQKIAFLQNNVASAGKVAFTLLKALV